MPAANKYRFMPELPERPPSTARPWIRRRLEPRYRSSAFDRKAGPLPGAESPGDVYGVIPRPPQHRRGERGPGPGLAVDQHLPTPRHFAQTVEQAGMRNVPGSADPARRVFARAAHIQHDRIAPLHLLAEAVHVDFGRRRQGAEALERRRRREPNDTVEPDPHQGTHRGVESGTLDDEHDRLIFAHVRPGNGR